MILTNSHGGVQPAQGLALSSVGGGVKAFRLSLVRHGQTNHNRLRLLQGQMDTQLNHFGREQASLLARYLKRSGIVHEQIYTSDLGRAHETAKILCAGDARRLAAIKRDCLLRERSYGKLQGLPVSAIRQLASQSAAGGADAPATPITDQQSASASDGNNSDSTQSWAPASKIHQPEGGETVDQVRARVDTFCDQVLFPNALHQTHVLVVSHGGTIREFLKLLRYKYGAQIKSQDLSITPNTGLSEFDICLNERHQVLQLRVNQLHQLPHLTFDVFNRDNPNVNLNNLHLKRIMATSETDRQDLRKCDQTGTLHGLALVQHKPTVSAAAATVAAAAARNVTRSIRR